MYKNIKLSASLMCADWLNLKNEIQQLEENNFFQHKNSLTKNKE